MADAKKRFNDHFSSNIFSSVETKGNSQSGKLDANLRQSEASERYHARSTALDGAQQ